MSDITIYYPEALSNPILSTNGGVLYFGDVTQKKNTGGIDSGQYENGYASFLGFYQTPASYITITPTPVYVQYAQIVSGKLPININLTYSTNYIYFSGIPKFTFFTDSVDENSYPIHTGTTDRWCFTLEVYGQFGVYARSNFWIDVRKDWCAVRNEYIRKVKNQSFAINKKIVPNEDFLNNRISTGIYTCP